MLSNKIISFLGVRNGLVQQVKNLQQGSLCLAVNGLAQRNFCGNGNKSTPKILITGAF